MYSSLTLSSLFIYHIFAYFPVISPPPPPAYVITFPPLFNRFCIRAALTFPRPQRSPGTRRNPLLGGTPSPTSPPPTPPGTISATRQTFSEALDPHQSRLLRVAPPPAASSSDSDALFTTGLLYAYSGESAAAERLGKLAGNEREERKRSGFGLFSSRGGYAAFQGPH